MTDIVAVTGDTYTGTQGGSALHYVWDEYYPEIEVANLAASTDILYARADGTAASASSGSGDSTAIGPGQRVTLTNELADWFQGEADNPGTSVSLVSSGTVTPFNIQGV